MSEHTPPMLLEYKRGMEEIRLRLDYTGFLHLRKVLELMAYRFTTDSSRLAKVCRI